MNMRTIIKSAHGNRKLARLLSAVSIIVLTCLLFVGAEPQACAQNAIASSAKPRMFTTAEEAADALIDAAEKYDEATLTEILGPNSYDIIHTGEPARDKEMSMQFAAEARTRERVTKGAHNTKMATLFVGNDDWPFPVPINERLGRWYFNSAA